MAKQTCGPLYRQALETWTGMRPGEVSLFAAGFVHGQAEKVYLGACEGAMFRPSPECRKATLAAVREAAGLYGLDWALLGNDELWLFACTSTAREKFRCLRELLRTGQVNTRNWHHVRGALCGVPEGEIDEHFHEREGYGEPCDRPQEGGPA